MEEKETAAKKSWRQSGGGGEKESTGQIRGRKEKRYCLGSKGRKRRHKGSFASA